MPKFGIIKLRTDYKLTKIIMDKPKIIQSSINPTKVSMTIKGVGIALIPVIIFIAGGLGFNFVEADLTELVNAIATLVSAVMIVYGLIRKIVIGLKK